MKNLIIVFLFLCAGISLNAQDLPEIVYLKNGNLIRGTIIKMVPDETLEIKSGDGKVYVYNMSDVERIEKKTSNRSEESKYDDHIYRKSDVNKSKPVRKRPTKTYAREDKDTENSSNSKYGNLSIGIKAGGNLATFTGDGADGADPKIGFNAGIFAEYTLPVNIYFHLGLEFTMKGGKSISGDENDKYTGELTESANPMYLQMPIHIGYRVALADDISLGLHAGPYIAYGIAGKMNTELKYKGQTDKTDNDFFGNVKDGGAKALDSGLGFGFDVDIQKFRIGLEYDFGLTNIGRSSDSAIKNNALSLHVGYIF